MESYRTQSKSDGQCTKIYNLQIYSLGAIEFWKKMEPVGRIWKHEIAVGPNLEKNLAEFEKGKD